MDEPTRAPLAGFTEPATAARRRPSLNSLLDRRRVPVLAAPPHEVESTPEAVERLTVARELGREDELLAALRGPVLVAAVGPVTAAPLDRAGIPSVQPERARLGALVRTVVEELPARRTRTAQAGQHLLELRGHSVLVDGRCVELTARQVGVLAALVDGGGRVLSRADLLRTAWRDEPADEHAVEMTVARLRTALGPAGRVVETVVKRGYRLAAHSEVLCP